jgi:hypothetical protein
MSVLNQTNDGFFNVLIVLVRVITRFGPRSREDLLRACGADVTAVSDGALKNTLNRWEELGLFETREGVVSVAEPYRATLGSSADAAEARLPRVARTVALAASNNERFWEHERSKSADLCRGIAWMLAQNVYELETTTGGLQSQETRQFKGKTNTIVRNDTRWNGLQSWMGYLGFGREGSPWQIDPTDALRDALPEIFASGGTLLTSEFVNRAAEVLPVLDRGVYRREVEAALKDSAWVGPREGMLSTSLSRALQRLDRDRWLDLKHESDTEGDALSLTGSAGRIWRDITHVEFTPKKAVR